MPRLTENYNAVVSDVCTRCTPKVLAQIEKTPLTESDDFHEVDPFIYTEPASMGQPSTCALCGVELSGNDATF